MTGCRSEALRCVVLVLSERDVAGAAGLLALYRTAHLEQTVQHFGAFSAAGGKLLISLFVNVLEPVQLVGNIKRRQNCNFQGVNGERAGGNLAHATVNILSQLANVVGIPVGANIVGLIVNFDANSRRCIDSAFAEAQAALIHLRIASAISG